MAQSVDSTTILVRYTLMGDADLDRTVGIGDFSLLAANFNAPATRWYRGDFDYNGTTDIGDFSLLAGNFNNSIPTDLPGRTSVPEPAGGLLIVAAALARRRRAEFA